MDRLEKLKQLRDACILQQATWANDPLIECGDFTYGQPIVHRWDDTTRLTVGKFCSIGGNVQILLGGEHHTEWITTYPFDVLLDDGVAKSKGNVIIGNDVWIGDNVMILSGVTIGDGAVIGAGSVVSRDVQPYTIVTGAPAHLKKIRPCWPDICGIEWWNWPIEKIAEAIPILSSGDIYALEEFGHD